MAIQCPPPLAAERVTDPHRRVARRRQNLLPTSFVDAFENSPGVRLNLLEMGAELGSQMALITSFLSEFTNSALSLCHSAVLHISAFPRADVETVRFSQEHSSTNLQNIGTIATFFSGVTATTLQFSITTTHKPIADAVNSFWFMSLVLSIGAAVNSLLGMTWKRSV